MKDEIVQPQTAKLAQEKGFDEWCDASYTFYLKDGGGEFPDTQYKEGDIGFNGGGVLKGTNSNHAKYESDFYQMYSAPTQSLLQKWLREEHNLHIDIFIEEDAPYNKFYYRTMLIGQYFTTSHDDDKSSNYEGALEKGLKEGLKLIK